MEEIKPNSEDISSYSNFNEILQKEVDMDVSLDFDKKQMIGKMDVKYQILSSDLPKIILDLKGPEITSIEFIEKDEDEEDLNVIPLTYEINTENQFKDSLGTPLIISLENIEKKDPNIKKKVLDSKNIIVRIKFITTEKCTAIQFLTKEQTYTKKYPFMFTQCEAIQCRSLFPVQDSPSVKSTYTVKTSIEAPLTFLFGGILRTRYYDSNAKQNITLFEQNIPIPSYLVAFVAGQLEYGRISERCGVWTEVGLCQKACYEFNDAERYIEIAEEYFAHPYEWKNYNLLVLPFSFPYGGMENPNLTFVTPALLAGDRSMSNVIGHEISHSWTGNLVTNKNWKNFWVNEGFTTFMERKLDSALLGEDMENLEAIVGNNELVADIKVMGEDSEYTKLSPDYGGNDPDDGFCTVPYEKGYQFLVFIEKKIGKDNFKEVMQRYIKKYKYQSVDYTAFQGVLEELIREKYKKKQAKKMIKEIDWDKWLNEKGFPANKMDFVSEYLKDAEKLAEDFLNEKEDDSSVLKKFKEWHTNVKLAFLNYLTENKDKIDQKILLNLKNKLHLAEEYNAEIKYMWYLLALDKKLEEEMSNIQKFLETHGRLKYIRPVFFAWIEKDFSQAKEFFEKVKYLYHPFARRIIQEKFDKGQ
jgi:leukotriene-A4 hydrolase